MIKGTCQTKKSAYAALISNISEKGRAKDVEQFGDILRTFINEMNKFECRFGATRDEEKIPTETNSSDLGTKHLTSERSEMLMRLVNCFYV